MNQAAAIISFLFICLALFWNYEEGDGKKTETSGSGSGVLGSLLAFAVIVPSLVIGGLAFTIGKLLHLFFLLLSTIVEALWEITKRLYPTMKKLLQEMWEIVSSMVKLATKAGKILWKSLKILFRSISASSRIFHNLLPFVIRTVLFQEEHRTHERSIEEEDVRWARDDEDILQTLRRIGWATRRRVNRHQW